VGFKSILKIALKNRALLLFLDPHPALRTQQLETVKIIILADKLIVPYMVLDHLRMDHTHPKDDGCHREDSGTDQEDNSFSYFDVVFSFFPFNS
jgi:hypothetical protein